MERLPHSYTNDTRRSGRVVVKRYEGPGAEQRAAREAAVLRALAGRVPVPAVLGVAGAELRTALVAGTHGQDLIAGGGAAEVLTACGEVLAKIHRVPVGEVFPGGEGVVVHGDFGPNNLLLDGDLGPVAVVDWERARPGDPVEDVAWCEWIVRTHHPEDAGDLAAFFAAYGARPPWPARHAAMLAGLRRLHAFAEEADPGGERAATRARLLRDTEAWGE